MDTNRFGKKPKKKQLRPNAVPHLYLYPASSARQTRTKQASQRSLRHKLRIRRLSTANGNVVVHSDAQVAAEENLYGEELILTSESDVIASEINSPVTTTAAASTQTRNLYAWKTVIFCLYYAQ